MLKEILNWSEVWAPLLVILVLVKYKITTFKGFVFIKAYLFISIFINLLADVVWRFKSLKPDWLPNNHIFYNTHSIVRTIFFILFFIVVANSKANRRLYQFCLATFLVISIAIFLFVDSIFEFNSTIFSLESLLLLIISLHILWQIFTADENIDFKKIATFWMATGVAVYEAASFPIFIFYSSLLKSTSYFAMHLWDLHNFLYIVLCLCIIKAIQVNSRIFSV